LIKLNIKKGGSLSRKLISVVIPTIKDREKMLKRAVDSIKRQTYKNYEIIIVSEGDNANIARNIGIKKAKGQYIAFLDDDDEWLPTKLEEQIKYIGKFHCIYTFFNIIKNGKIIDKHACKFQGNIHEKLLNRNWIGTCSTALINKECFEMVGMFDEELPACQDWDMWIRLSKHYPFKIIPKYLTNYYVHKRNLTQKNISKHILGHKMLYEKIKNEMNLSQKLNFKKIIFRRYIKRWLVLLKLV